MYAMHIYCVHLHIHNNDENAMQMQFCSTASFSALPYLEPELATHWSDLQDDYDGVIMTKGAVEDEEDEGKDNEIKASSQQVVRLSVLLWIELYVK